MTSGNIILPYERLDSPFTLIIYSKNYLINRELWAMIIAYIFPCLIKKLNRLK